ncbi:MULTISPECIES: phosphate ABC transporter substrate-binding protein PstS [unclassified Nocardioides]|uniref:phosphate ABC transporter substrate-binding protein PstS n=1 Tax=Nocardioides sp. URHA0032 TaxID=1380388 RepID=UPI00048A5DFD|nr:phosphate ABC transporter substrate-binding protein PstS [Nocardioides sp. URHA0032]
MKRIIAVVLFVGALLAPVPAQASESYVPISGAGSTWSQVAVDAWRADVRASGVVVNFAGTGSTDGRSQFIQGTVDFANTEIPFQNPPEPGQQAEVPSRDFAYLPIVAGGTSFMYNLTVGGQRVRDLRLSGTTLAKIFTGAITRWSDPAIEKDYGKPLPDIPIIPVVRSDGAGASAQFSLYMRSQANSIYCPFIRSELHLSGSDCPSVSFYPSFGSSKAQVGSNGVANYVSASYGAGSIGYVEYAYAKRIDFPVVSLLNKAGYYSQPTAGNVAVALTGAKINSDLTQNLESVYTNRDPRTYPMSSYSYMVVPTSTDSPFNADKGKTLSTFINYFLCAGQQKADILGYSPLPKNLVLAGFDQVKRIPGAVRSPSISDCDNPALDILQSAPMPSKCDRIGSDCTTTNSGGGTGASGGTGTSGGTGGAGGPGATGGSGGTGAGGDAPGAIDPLTGGTTGGAVDPATGTAAGATATPLQLTGGRSGQATAAAWVAAIALALTVMVPPFLLRRSRTRR